MSSGEAGYGGVWLGEVGLMEVRLEMELREPVIGEAGLGQMG